MRVILILVFTALTSISYASTGTPPISDIAKVDTDIFYNDMEVIQVTDGDTLIAGNDRIRIWGIDAPEKDEPLYEEAKIVFKHLVGDRISCKHIEIDRYKRNVMQCINKNGNDVAAMMVQFGYAKDFKRYSGGFYASEEEWAKQNKSGIWQK